MAPAEEKWLGLGKVLGHRERILPEKNKGGVGGVGDDVRSKMRRGQNRGDSWGRAGREIGRGLLLGTVVLERHNRAGPYLMECRTKWC